MLPNQLIDFIAYFRSLQEKHKELKSFVHGASERIISQSRSELEYPCFWLETPVLHLSENQANNVTGDRICAFVVLKNAPTENELEQDLIWNETEAIALDILSRIRKDQRTLNFRFDFNLVTMEPISTLHVDNEYGWRVEFRLKNFVELCYNPSKWND